MHSIKYLFGILILHFIYITITRSDVGKYNKAIQHALVTFCNKSPFGKGGGGRDYLPTAEKKRFATNHHGGGGGGDYLPTTEKKEQS